MIDDAKGGDRRTGRTYKSLLGAIGRCVGKHRAAVMFGSDAAARHGARMAFEMITPLLPDGFAKFSHQRRSIEFGNGSRIDFLVPSSRVEGLRFNSMVLDGSLEGIGPREAALVGGLLRGIVRD
jgi:hypothetical protein